MSESQSFFSRSKHDRQNPYVMISRSLAQDETISVSARGMMIYLLSLPDDWKIYHTQLMKSLRLGEHALNTIINELIESGYIKRTRERIEGKFCPYNYEISESKQFEPELKESLPNGIFRPGPPSPGNQGLQNKQSLPSEEIQKKQTTEQESSVVCSFDAKKEEMRQRLYDLKLDEHSVKTILSLKPSMDALNSALECAKSYNPDNLGGYIYKAVKGNWKASSKSPAFVESNKEWAQRQEAKLTTKLPKNYAFNALNTYLEVGSTTGQTPPACISYDERVFKELVFKHLEKIGIINEQ